MQQNHLKLKEIIWEITGECQNGCDYCGSKEVNRIKTPSKEKILEIAEEIVKYPPEQIDISGGDPLLIPYETHKEIVGLFKSQGIISKILTNPKSLTSLLKVVPIEVNTKFDTLNLYDWVGISINTPEELELFEQVYNAVFKCNNFKKFTVITNFNVINLYNYKLIENLVNFHNVPWMVQFTIYPEKNNKLAVYNHDNVIEELRQKIQGSIQRGINIIISDNATPFACGAGKATLGILYDGRVVPCLSMRSWKKDITEEIQGDLFEIDLKTIWESDFKKYRFGCFECCKDFCKNKLLVDVVVPLAPEKTEPIFDIEKIKKKLDIRKPLVQPPTVMLYGVQPDNVVMYAVQPGGTYVYAVFAPSTGTDITFNLNDKNITPVYSVFTNITIPEEEESDKEDENDDSKE